jgi:hypothetical protein
MHCHRKSDQTHCADDTHAECHPASLTYARRSAARKWRRRVEPWAESCPPVTPPRSIGGKPAISAVKPGAQSSSLLIYLVVAGGSTVAMGLESRFQPLFAFRLRCRLESSPGYVSRSRSKARNAPGSTISMSACVTRLSKSRSRVMIYRALPSTAAAST